MFSVRWQVSIRKHLPASHVIYQSDMGKTQEDPKLIAGRLKGQTKLCMRTD